MKTRFWVLVLLLALFTSDSFAARRKRPPKAVNPCAQILTATEGTQRDLRSIPNLKVGTYNVENLFVSTGKVLPVQPGVYQTVAPPKPKSPKAMEGIARAIADADLDVVIVQEVESAAALQAFVATYLGDRYHVLLIDGNDRRGIDVGFIVKKDLPLTYVLESNRGELWRDPTQPEAGSLPLFARDVPVLSVYAKGFSQRGPPLLSILGVHYKSKRNRPGDEQGRILRKAEVDRTVEIWNRLKRQWGENARILLAGDFNGEIFKEPEFEGFNRTDAVDSFRAFDRITGKPTPFRDTITHTYHPRGERTHYSQMDYILMSRSLQGLVEKTYVYRYKDDQGREWPIPQTFRMRSMNPSDHFPVIMHLRFQEVVAANEAEQP